MLEPGPICRINKIHKFVVEMPNLPWVSLLGDV